MERHLMTSLFSYVNIYKKPSDRLFQSTHRVCSAIWSIWRYTVKVSHVLDLKGAFIDIAAEFTRAVSMVEAKSKWKVVEEILEGRKKVDLILVHHFREGRLVPNGGCEREYERQAEWMQGWLRSLLMLNLAFSFQMLLVKHVEGSVLGENLAIGVDTYVVTDLEKVVVRVLWYAMSFGVHQHPAYWSPEIALCSLSTPMQIAGKAWQWAECGPEAWFCGRKVCWQWSPYEVEIWWDNGIHSALAGGRNHWNLLMGTLKGGGGDRCCVLSGVLSSKGCALSLAED